MKKILVSGLINTETTVKVREFPIKYYPIDYSFFGVNTRVSGVAYNIAKALTTLGDKVVFTTMTGDDFGSQYINYSLKEAGKIIATDVHVLRDINDEYNQDFMNSANILFLSDEGIDGDYKDFISSIENKFHNDIIVLGMGSKGALMYVKADDKFYELPAYNSPKVVNTVGAGDSLFSSFIHYYAKGLEPVACLKKSSGLCSL